MKKILVFLIAACGALAQAQTIVITTNSTWVDGVPGRGSTRDVVVRACTLTVNGTLTARNLILENGAIVTHSQGSAGMYLILAENLRVPSECQISATGRGYGVAAGPGAGAYSWYGGGGGGHGGRGADSAGGGGASYGSFLAPMNAGSGGGGFGGYSQDAGFGGGIIRAKVGGEIILDGTIAASGTSAGYAGGGGSGGSVWLVAKSISGSGMISANGGNSGTNGGGGAGGGRVALESATSLFSGVISAYGGPRGGGGAGTVWLNFKDQNLKKLIVDNNGAFGAGTEMNSAVIPGDLLVDRGGQITHQIRQGGFALLIQGNATIGTLGRINLDGLGFGPNAGPGAGAYHFYGGGGGGHGGRGADSAGSGGTTYDSFLEPIQLGSGGGGSGGYSHEAGSGGGAVHLQVGGTLAVDGAISANGSSMGGGGGGAGGGIWIETESLVGSGVISANGGNWGGGGGRVACYYMSSTFTGEITAYGSVHGAGGAGTVWTKRTTASRGRLMIDNGGTNGAATQMEGHVLVPGDVLVTGAARISPPLAVEGLHIEVLGNVRVDAGCALDADGLGFRYETGPGAGIYYYYGGSGAGHGGHGGENNAYPYSNIPGGQRYGSASSPVTMGSGGGGGVGYHDAGGRGGGAIRLSVVGALSLLGRVSANATTWGGSGGSIWITAGSIAGPGTISARGATGMWGGGGGGGGRIALYRGKHATRGQFTVDVSGGASSGGGGSPGENGTFVNVWQ